MTCKVTLAEDGAVTDTTGCNEKETSYIEKIKSWDKSKFGAESERLASMKAGKMKPELLAWIDRRTHILKQFVKGEKKADEEL
jgi:hypothetical protein